MEPLLNISPLVAPAVLFFLLFLALETRDRRATTVMVVFVLLIADSALYASQNEIPGGIFHPSVGSLSFRLLDVAVVAAIAARLLTSAAGSQASYAGLLWCAAIAWILTSAAVGLYNDNTASLVGFQAKVAIYLGAFVLTAGVPAERFVKAGHALRLVQWSAVLATVLLVTHETGVRIATGWGWLPLVDLGRMGSDAGTLLAAIGLLGVAIGIHEPQRRGRWLVPAAPLLACALAVDQRAALMALLASLLVLGVAAGRSRRKVYVTPTEVALVVAIGASCLLAPVVVQLATAPSAPQVPYLADLENTLYGRDKILSAEERINQLREAKELILERPVYGWGLGKEFVYYRTGYREFQLTDLTHNVLVDLWLRTGFVGMALFLAALGTTLAGGAHAWARRAEAPAAPLLLGAMVVVAGLLPKALVENLFEKYRMALLLGLGIGFVLAGARAARGAPDPSADAPDDVRVVRPEVPHPRVPADLLPHL